VSVQPSLVIGDGGFRSNQNHDPGEQFLLIEAMDRVSTFREVFSF
jgi:hypothetical protein